MIQGQRKVVSSPYGRQIRELVCHGLASQLQQKKGDSKKGEKRSVERRVRQGENDEAISSVNKL